MFLNTKAVLKQNFRKRIQEHHDDEKNSSQCDIPHTRTR